MIIYIAPIVISTISVFVSFFIYKQNRYLLSGGMEIKIREYINTTKVRWSDMLILKANTNSKKKAIIEAIDNAIDNAIEENLNAYEEACAKYIDNKIDKERLKKMFYMEIVNLIENEDLGKYFEKGSNYTNILDVFNEWNNIDK